MQVIQSRHPVLRSTRLSRLVMMFLGAITVCWSIADAGLVVRPVFVFVDYPSKSTVVTVRNDGDQPIEVMAEIRYGYHISNDTGKLIIVYPESLASDDRSMKTWIRPYPQRFVLGPLESQGVRLFVTPPPGSPAGEYWGKLLFTPHVTNAVNQKKTGGTSLQVITQVEVPLHYRLTPVSTGLDLDGISDVKFDKNSVQAKATFRRTGNASYWGTLHARVLDAAGKIAGSLDRHVVVYKYFVVNLTVPVDPNYAGPYRLEMIVETKRDDLAPRQVVHSDTRRWTFPVTTR